MDAFSTKKMDAHGVPLDLHHHTASTRVEETKKSSPDEERTAKVEELANGT
jgi:hypothetical protein